MAKGEWQTANEFNSDIRDEFKNEFKRSSTDARGRLGTLGDGTQTVCPRASRNVWKRNATLPRWMSRVRPPFPAPANFRTRSKLCARLTDAFRPGLSDLRNRTIPGSGT